MFVIRILDGGDEKRYAFNYRDNAVFAFRNRIRMYKAENSRYNLENDVFIGLYADNDCEKLIDSTRIYANHKYPANVELGYYDLLNILKGLNDLLYVLSLDKDGIFKAQLDDIKKTRDKIIKVLGDDAL